MYIPSPSPDVVVYLGFSGGRNYTNKPNISPFVKLFLGGEEALSPLRLCRNGGYEAEGPAGVLTLRMGVSWVRITGLLRKVYVFMALEPRSRTLRCLRPACAKSRLAGRRQV